MGGAQHVEHGGTQACIQGGAWPRLPAGGFLDVSQREPLAVPTAWFHGDESSESGAGESRSRQPDSDLEAEPAGGKAVTVTRKLQCNTQRLEGYGLGT